MSDDMYSNRGPQGEERVQQESHRQVHRAGLPEPSSDSLRLVDSPFAALEEQWSPRHGQEILQAP